MKYLLFRRSLIILVSLGLLAQTSLLLSAEIIDRLYEGFGNFHRSITTESEKAQELFDQGFRMTRKQGRFLPIL